MKRPLAALALVIAMLTAPAASAAATTDRGHHSPTGSRPVPPVAPPAAPYAPAPSPSCALTPPHRNR
jgi:hypothetical protein